MRIDTWAVPCGVEKIEDSVAVVIDVLRASTTMTAALENGASGILPVRSVEEAFRLKEVHPGFLLAGERDAFRVEGFDLGNSPFEYTPDAVKGKTVVMTTTNGTQAAAAGKNAARLIAAGFRNLDAVCSCLKKENRPVAILCAGTKGRYSAEDALCAGMIAHRLGGEDICDFTRLCRDIYRDHESDLFAYLSESVHARNLYKKGFGADVEYAFTLDVSDLIPVRDPDGILRKMG